MNNPAIYNNAPAYSRHYFDLIETDDLLLELENSFQLTLDLFSDVKPEQENYAYADGKWTLNEVLRHIIDCERIFAYRALRFSRLDATELPGFDEDHYMASLKGMHWDLASLLQEYSHVRKSSMALFENMSGEMFNFKGNANGFSISTQAVGFMIVGHNLHHLSIVKSRYLGNNHPTS